MKDNEFEKLKERHEAPQEGCMFHVLALVGLTAATIIFSLTINEFFPSRYGTELFSIFFFFGFAGIGAWASDRAEKRQRRLELRLWLKYDYPSLLEKASKGDPDEQYWLGMGVHRHGCAKECGPAIFWLLMAANQGHHEAQEYVAILYRNGEGVPKDLEKSSYWLSKAEGKKKQAG